MNTSERIEAFVDLGQFLEQFVSVSAPQNQSRLNDEFHSEFQEVLERVTIENPWFTPDHVRCSLQGICMFLKREKLDLWLKRYSIPNATTGKRIAVIMAGNIPMVGFHDMLCVLMAGHQFIGKLSSKDNQLLDVIARMLFRLNPEFGSLISFRNDRLSGERDFDAIIATGSNNSARYFEAYFGKYPNIIRRNRNSVAVLSGKESNTELEALGNDIFLYFGLGCRNVSKLYLPKGFDVKELYEAWEGFADIIQHTKYANNYDYQKSLFLMNQIQHMDNGFLLLKEDQGMSSPIGVVYYEFYSDIHIIEQILESQKDNIQCIVGNQELIANAVPFGQAQQPELWDYADNVDTMEFLTQFVKNN